MAPIDSAFRRLASLGTRALNRVSRAIRGDPDAYLKNVRGVIHVGANTGQERFLYAAHALDVVWIEPIPRIFDQLVRNLAHLPRQRCYQHLITDRDGEKCILHIANNNGESSSILRLDQHRDVWPHIYYNSSITLNSITLATMTIKEKIDASNYDALILDTQGSELLVLRGAGGLLNNFKYIRTEAADFPIYRGCCQVEDLNAFLEPRGFREIARECFAVRAGGGRCYNLTYQQRL